jgi:hypothetical protein
MLGFNALKIFQYYEFLIQSHLRRLSLVLCACYKQNSLTFPTLNIEYQGEYYANTTFIKSPDADTLSK